MSRVAKAPVVVPAGVDVKINGQVITIKGKNGELTRTLNDAAWLVQSRNRLLVFLNQVDTFNNDLAGRQDILNFTALTFIFTG